MSTFPSGSYFREQWRRAPLEVEIEGVARLEDFLIGDKLELSLRRYIELVLANNPDVNLQKLVVHEQRNSIERALSPFDPTLTASFSSTRSTTPSNDLLQGADVRTQLRQTTRFIYDKTMDTGTNYQVVYTGGKTADNSQFTSFNPSITQSIQISLSQPLLRNRGRFVQRVPIMIAESRLNLTEAQVRERILALLVQAENAYWDVIDARESLSVRKNGLDLARAFLERSRRELELGAISPLDIFQPEQQFATAQVQVTQFQYRLKQAEDSLRRWIGADLDPAFRHVPIALSESAEPPADTPELDAEALVAKALSLRPELEQNRRQLEITDLNIRAATNQLRPDLSINASYSSQGRGGNFFERTLSGGARPETFIPGGFPDALNQLFQFRFPVYSFGVTLQLPIRNRRAAANLSDFTIQKKRELYNLRSQEQVIRLDVLRSVSGVELSIAAIEQASVARDFASKRLDAEQRKYDLGVTTAFLVLEAQNALVESDADLLAQSIAYRRSMIDLLSATAELFDVRGVVVRYD